MKTTHFLGMALTCAGACILVTAATAVPKPVPLSKHGLHQYDKVVIVIEENQQEMTIIGNSACPYTNTLANDGALITQSYGCEHPSQPNYLDLFSGSDQNIYSDSAITVNPFSGDNLGAELLHHGLTFVGFSEDLPYAGDTVDLTAADPADPAGTTDYVRKHNPWVNWQNDAYPASPVNPGSNYLPSWINQPLTPFSEIVASGNFSELPTVSVVVPSEQHDDHGVSGGLSGDALLAAGDTWLQQNIGAYATWAKKHNSLLIVTWDEDDYSAINKIPTIFYGEHVKIGQFSENTITSFTSLINGDTEPSGPPQYYQIQGINHWNVLRTIEDMYDLGYAGASANAEPVTNVF